MSTADSVSIKEKFINGLELYRQRLIALKKKEAGELNFSKNEKVFTVSAKDLK